MSPVAKYDALLTHLATYESALIAYSGGVDSTLLAFSAHAVLGPKCLAVLARSDTYPETEAESARAVARMLGLRLHEVETNELVDPAFRANTPDRCYHCKTELFALLRTIATSRGLSYVLDGSNVDDLADYRPGSRAAAEFGVRSPLSEVGFTKDDIREVAAMLELPNWDKPSMACLASRFPYGEEITEERLRRVAEAEAGVRSLGLRQFRVRAHGDVARVEVDSGEMDRAWGMREEMASAIKEAGFTFVAADLTGYRTGSLNEALPPQE
ncbi:MAG: TIGR00268 family protein [Actinobacteria bacterium HGW-Actinobacteria-10]|nr:MAG: TIGR00268 family protein [Actinobacteria bacterium HGW-Actinobacteria-10]